jgi:adenosine deaminase
VIKDTAPLNQYVNMPKVDLHRHLEGSLRLATMVDIVQHHGVKVSDSIIRLSGLVQVQDEDPQTYANFLEKFKTLRSFYRSPEVIHRITREAVEDAARDHVRYLELRFSPVALSRAEGFPMNEVMEWVLHSAHAAAEINDIKVGLIASVNRHESPELAEQVAWLAAGYQEQGLVGLDLAGNEADFKSEPFYGIFKEAAQAGLRITIHAGEWGPAANVREAIEELGALRIGHGMHVMEDENVVAVARERGTAFEVCITSNYQSGVVPALHEHPLPNMLQAGLNVTLNSDDPSVSRITLANEYQRACEDLKIPMHTLKERILASAQAAFLSDGERAQMVAALREELEM